MTLQLKAQCIQIQLGVQVGLGAQVGLGVEVQLGLEVALGQGQLGSCGPFWRSSCTWTGPTWQFCAILAFKLHLNKANWAVCGYFSVQVALGQGQLGSFGCICSPSCTWSPAGQAHRRAAGPAGQAYRPFWRTCSLSRVLTSASCGTSWQNI